MISRATTTLGRNSATSRSSSVIWVSPRPLKAMISAASITSQNTSKPNIFARVVCDTALRQKAVHSRPLGENVEVDRTQRLHHGEACRLGEQPAADEHHHSEHQTRQEDGHLREQHAHRLEKHVNLVHGDISFGEHQSGTWRPARARMPSSGIRIQPGRFSISYRSSYSAFSSSNNSSSPRASSSER